MACRDPRARPDEQAPLAAAGLRFMRAGDWLYSSDPAAPAIGDVRVRFAAAPRPGHGHRRR
ncbi:MAG: hypothetical protein U1E17_09085 [Geminicoccaceae bacterium]